MTYLTGELASTTATLALAGPPAQTEIDSTTPDLETAAYQRSLPRWTKCRALMAGTEAIRAGGTLYLPQHPSESLARYETRRTIAALFNGFKRTVIASVGLILSEEPVLGEDMPEDLVALWESVDGKGTHGTVFAAKLTTAGLVDGLAGILTEYPRADDPRIDRSNASLAATVALETGAELDAADVKAMGLRPYFILVKADAVILPLYESVNGRDTLVMLVIRETASVRKGRFGFKDSTRYRVYTLENKVVRYERWSTDNSTTPTRDEGPTVMRNINCIPWSPLLAGDEIGPGEYMPPLMDLADLNIEHHQIKTGILSLESLAFVPTPVRVGAVADADGEYPALVLGPGNTIEAPATEGVTTPVYWLSPPIDVLDPGMRSLESCKAEMGAMGASFLAPQPSVEETATAHRMDGAAERSSISKVSRALKDCLEAAFGHAGQYIKQPAGSVTLNAEFSGEGVDPAYLAVVVSAYQQGALSLEELRYVLQTGQLPETFDAADTMALITRQIAKDDADAAEAKRVAEAAKGRPDPA